MPIHDFVQKLKENPLSSREESEPEGEAVDLADRMALADAMRDYTAEMAPDPKPGRRAGPKAPKQQIKIAAAVRREVRDGLTMMITLPAGIWAFRDPCGESLLEHGENIAAKLTPIVCRNPRLVEWFTQGTGYMEWYALATAVAPFAKTVWDHHVVGPRAQHGGEEDERAPDAGPADYSQFAAPVFSG